MDRQTLIQLAEEWIPFNKHVGLRALRVERGNILFEIPFREELIGDPMKRAIHGGVISMLADTAGGFAVWSVLDEPRSRVSTIDLRIDYLLPGKPEHLHAHASVVRAGKAVGVADIRVFHPSHEHATIATGKGVYAIRTFKEQLPI
ncbi:MAG: hotdog fold thioesterase [Polyangiaceae bacterium]